MKTKHVLMTTALMALFAACTNDDFISNGQGVQSGDASMRPSVDVTLNVLDNGADTRLAFDGVDGYTWQENDTIGALLMDKVIASERPSDGIEAWEELAWTSRYELVDYINTDYPFVRNSAGEWVTNAKMLEGNYFFTFPFASYSGNREAVHSIGEQVQDGTTDASLAEAYAKNNFFIGYARIHAGTTGAEVMSADLEMTPALGAVGVIVKQTGNQDFTVKKIVLQSEAFNTLIKINPTDAQYTGENGKQTSSPYYNINNTLADWTSGNVYFNYANYEEMTRTGNTWAYNDEFKERYADGTLVNNTEKSANYDRKNALLAVIEGVDGADDRAELTVLNAPVQKGNSNSEQRFLIMTNIYKNGTATDKPIYAYIYTDRGMAGPVKISDVKSEVVEDNGVTIITNNPIVEIGPGIANSVTLEIDDNSIQPSDAMNVYNESDLLQLIEWNQKEARVYTANLQNDVTLTKEMSDLLTKAGVNSKMLVRTQGHKMILDKEVAGNILDYVLVDGSTLGDDNKLTEGVATIKVENDLTLGSKSYVSGTYKVGNIHTGSIDIQNQLEIAEGANVTVTSAIKNETNGDYTKQALKVVENEGTLTINAVVEQLTIADNNADVNINANVTFTGESKNNPNATMTIGKDATVSAGKLTNEGKSYTNSEEDAEYAVIYNNGRINNLVNEQYGKVIAGATSTTNVEGNNGIIDISSNINAEWKVNKGEVGTVSFTATGKVALTDVIKSGLTELVVDGGEIEGVAKTSTNSQANASAAAVKKVIVKENGGKIGNAEFDANGNRLYWRTQFPNAMTVETNGNATLIDVDLAGAENIYVKSGETVISGTVNATGATITLGSYDSKQYIAHDATLNLPTKNDELYVKTIVKTTESDEVIAKVYNQGYVEIGESQSIGEGVDWEGTGEENFEPGEAPGPAVDMYTIEVVKGGSLADLANVNLASDAEITIKGGVDMSLDNNKNNVGLLAGKNVIIDGGGFLNLTEDMGLTMKSLTVGSSNCIIKSVGNQPNTVVLTVDNLSYPVGTTLLFINNPYVKVSGAVQAETGSYITSGGKITGKGGIVADNADGSGLVWWNQETNKWTKF